ncbi:MAG: bifunctional transaldolase/phosoglucose isomerase, partial [Chloroflexota bacterium]
LMDVLRQKIDSIQAGQVRHEVSSLGEYRKPVDHTLHEMAGSDFIGKLWNKDPALWKPNPAQQQEITNRLGWLHVSDVMVEHERRLAKLAADVRQAGYTDAVVLGMGGSSLAPFVMSEAIGSKKGSPRLVVLDSTDPLAIANVEQQIELDRTLFMVSSKSGTTTETLSFFRTFWEKLASNPQRAQHFVAITDPGTPLAKLARENGFRATFLNPADIGGRYSALSYFGLVPAAVAGIDVPRLLGAAVRMEHACEACVPADQNPGASLGAIMADCAKAGRDKVTFLLSPRIESLGLWLEQLLAESTGKEGKGLIPVPGNPPGVPDDYGIDRLFACLRMEGDDNAALDDAVEALAKHGAPIVRLDMGDVYDLGAEFFRWEFATAVAGALLQINAFDQPNVQESKDNTKRLLQMFEASGSLPQPSGLAAAGGIELAVNEAGRSLLPPGESDVEDGIASFLSHLKPPKYLALMAYVAPSSENDRLFRDLRASLRDDFHVATTFGYGPRFLHSTGQLHKGGPPAGLFIQITATAHHDIPVPDEPYSYQTLIDAQSLGDFQSLQQHGRPAIRLTLKDESPELLRAVADLLSKAGAGSVLTH